MAAMDAHQTDSLTIFKKNKKRKNDNSFECMQTFFISTQMTISFCCSYQFLELNYFYTNNATTRQMAYKLNYVQNSRMNLVSGHCHHLDDIGV